MKPTEADIQAELIEGWRIFSKKHLSNDPDSEFLGIKKDDLLNISFFEKECDISFDHKIEEFEEIDFPDFLTGKYDLSAISQHYDPEEWQRIITMCERIVRLITGEQVEQTLEEKVDGFLGPFTDGTHAEFYSPSMITVSRFDANVRYHIYSDRIERVDKQPGCIHHDKYTLQEYRDRDGSQLGKAYIAIAALLTPSDQPEQTLEEAVKGHLTGMKYRSLNVKEDRVCFFELTEFDRPTLYLIEKDKICFEDEDEWKEYPPAEFLSKYGDGPEINRVPLEIAAEISKRSTKPSYSDLEQRVEELEKEAGIWKDLAYKEESRADQADENLRVTKKELSDLKESYIQQGSVEGQKLEQAQECITDLEAQLQDYISPADHEAELKKLYALISDIDADLTKARNDAARNLRWFHREYAKNAEASQ